MAEAALEIERVAVLQFVNAQCGANMRTRRSSAMPSAHPMYGLNRSCCDHVGNVATARERAYFLG